MKKILTGLILAAAVMAPHWAQAAAPAVNNNGGASNVLSISAKVNGTVISTGGVPTQVYVYWGTTNGGTTFGNWGHTNDLGTNGVGLLSLGLTNLIPNQTYYYRFFATNVDGSAWAVATTNFKTLAAAGPLAVNLRSTANFTILAGDQITYGGSGVISGDVGLSPAAGSRILIVATNVAGTIYAVDATYGAGSVIDPTRLTAAKGDLTLAYNEARDRTPVPTGTFLNPGAGNIGGMNLVPGLYKFDAIARIAGSDVTLTGGPNDVWIFQIGTQLIVDDGVNRKVILAGGALAKNVFWQVGSQAILGTYCDFKGTIMANTSIIMDVGSTMEGRALAFSGEVVFYGSGGSLPSAAKAINPTPANGATGQVITVSTSWQNGGGATNYAVYFGTNPAPGSAEFKTNQTATSFNPGTLSYSNAYYWRIDSINAGGTIPGDIWSFTTAGSASPGTFQFNTSTSSVSESASSLTVTVTRLSGSFGAASVNYATSNGTAIAGSNYVAAVGTLNWTNGQTSAKTFVVTILDNLIYEGNKTFTVALTNAIGASLGFTVLKTVTIVENDTPSETAAPSIIITVPTNSPTYTSLTNLLTVGGTASDNIGVTRVTLRNSRDVADYTAAGTNNWTFTGLPLFQGTNLVTAIAYDASGNSATDTVQVVYTGDANYDNVLRSGNIVQEIVFPDNLKPGETVTVQWKVLSYAPITSRIYGGVPGGWFFYQNGTYKGVTNSLWTFNGHVANLYSFECAFVVPQKSGDCDIWFNVAQMDSDQFMIPVIPDGVDLRPNPAYPKLIKRTILADGNGANPASDPDTWDRANIFETVVQHKERSAVTITSLTMPDNIPEGSDVTCEWKVQSYIDVNAELKVINLATNDFWLTSPAQRIGTPTDTTYYFTDRISGERFYAKEYTFQSTFTVPRGEVGTHRIYFRSWPSDSLPAGKQAAENLSAGVVPLSQQVQENGMYGRFILRTINP
jgi:hypothetical protein